MLNTYLIYHLINCIVLVIRTLLYIGEKQGKRERDTGRAEQKEQTEREKQGKREDQGEGCRRHLRPFLASLLFRPLSSPSAPSPAAHPLTRSLHHLGRGKGGHLVRFWAMPSPHLATPRHTSPPIDQQQGSPSAVCHPARPRPLPLRQVVRVRAERQPGRAIPSRSPCRPSPPCRGAPRHIGGHLWRGAEIHQPYQSGGRWFS